MAHTFNPSTWRPRQPGLYGFEASLFYIGSPGQPGYTDKLSQKAKQKQEKECKGEYSLQNLCCYCWLFSSDRLKHLLQKLS